MEIFIKLFYALLFILIGILILKYRRNVKSWTGNFYWAEHYLGRGSTYFVIIIIALFLIFLGIIYPFGGFELIFGNENSIKNTLKNK